MHHEGDPPELFEPGIPVVLEGRWASSRRRLQSDAILVKHAEQYEADNGDRLDDAEDGRDRRRHHAVNATLGTAGVVLGVDRLRPRDRHAGASGSARSDRSSSQTGWSYSLLVLLGAVVAVIAMQRALITRDFTVGFVHDNGSSRTPPTLQRGDDVVRPRGLDPAVGADPRRLHRARGPASSGAGWRPARRLRAADDARRLPLLLPADARARPTRSPRSPCRPATTARARTRSCRSTSSWRSTRRCSTSATSGSRCRSRSPSPRWPPVASARAG